MMSSLSSQSLVELLIRRAGEDPGRLGYVFLAEGESESARLTYGELDRRARDIAAHLARSSSPGDRALLLFPPGLDFVSAFFGCLYAGVIAVPAYPPNFRKDSARLEAILRDAGPRAILATAALASRARSAGLEGLPWIAVDELTGEAGAEPWRAPRVDASTVAFLQYTSGSTGDPKGVIVSHGNLLHNEGGIRRVFGQSERSAIVGWLPLYHDMGLIGNVLQPLFVGAPCVLMSPASFLQRPRRWLEAISRYRATTSGGPNFAYDLCVRRIPPAEREGLDLSCWEVAFNGAEPVRDETLRRFAEAFAPCGFSPRAFSPCYGLAEATLMVSGVGKAETAPAVALDVREVGRNQVVAAAGEGSTTLVSSGEPFPDQEVVIVDLESLSPCPPGRIGEIWLRGASVTGGYWNRPEETARTFGARLADTGEGPFLRTGDLGFHTAGGLFVTGRLKDLIIIRGRNLYPQDIERTVEASHPALRPGGCAAFAVEGPGEERLVVVQELEPRVRALGDEETEAIAAAVRHAVIEEHEVRIQELALIPAGDLPRTTSGKVRRRSCRDLFLAGALKQVGHSALAQEEGPEVALSAADLRAIDPAERQHVLERHLAGRLARALRVPLESVDLRHPLASLGLDSLAAIELRHGLEIAFGSSPELADLLTATGEEVAAWLHTRLDEAADRETVPFRSGEELGDHPASRGQRALWFLERLAPGNGAYHLSAAVRVRGRLDRGVLERALTAAVARHPALRTVFVERGDEVLQRVLPAAPLELAWEDASHWSAEVAWERLAGEAARPFDLEHGPLLRAAVLSQSPEEHVLSLVFHHGITDFWSLGILARELGALLRQEGGGELALLPELPLRYSDFVRWQEAWLTGDEGERATRWWEETLAGAAELELSTDRPRPPVRGFQGGAVHLHLEPSRAAALRELAHRRGATLFMLLLAVYQTLLHRLSGQEDLVVGTPSAGRFTAELGGLVGYFVNPLPVRADLSGAPPFAALLDRTREASLAAFRHQGVPFPRIAERLHVQRDASRSPIFQTLFVLQRADRPEEEALAAFALGEAGIGLDLGGLEVESLPLERRTSQFDLSLAAAPIGGGLSLCLEHDAELFDRTTAASMLRQIVVLLQGILATPEAPLHELPLLDAAERAEVLRQGCAPAGRPPGELLQARFEEIARRQPDAVALVDGKVSITYGELDGRANQLARHLQSLGVGPEVRVGVCTERSGEMVVGILGILKAGGAYVPLDPAYPGERLKFMLTDSAAPVLLTQERLEAVLPAYEGCIVRLDADWPWIAAWPATAPACAAGPWNLAYLIYTSGSTGRPKGVAIEHRSPVSLVDWAREEFTDAELAGVLAATSICFDLAVFELFVPLSWRGRVILAANALELPKLPAASEVTLVNTVPSAIAELVGMGAVPPSVRVVNLAGEPLRGALVRQIEETGTVERVLNLYGPSEDTTYSTWAPARGEGRPPTIGRPLRGTRAHVLDGSLSPVPPGVVGELFLGGDGLARGYLGRPDLTAERFLPDPWAHLTSGPGARLYRTGDLARVLPDGELDFLGRADHQVKIRGHRVELGEIEAALLRHSAVRQAVVVARRDGAREDLRLVAYAAAACDPAALRNELATLLREALPAAMQPAAFVILPALPLTPSGKIDRKSLPAPAFETAGGGAPRSAAEALLAEIFAAVLGIPQVGREDDFFILGGHSLLAVRVLSRIGQAFGVDLPLAALFQSPTVEGMASRLAALSATPGVTPPPLVPTHREVPLQPSFAQQRLWFLHQLDPESAAYHIPGVVRLRGPLDPTALESALEEIGHRHESLRTRFRGLAGEPVQEIVPDPPRPVWIDLTALPMDVRERESGRLADQEARRPFDLARGPLCRTCVLRLSPADHRLAVTLHHIVADGASLEIFLRELATLYGAASAGEPSPLAGPPLQYADFAAWQRQALADEALATELAWWRERLAGAPVVELPADRPRHAGVSDRGGILPLDLPAVEPSLRTLCRAAGVTSYMALTGGLTALLARLTGGVDILLGTPVSNRHRPETEGMIGLLINTLTLRTGLGGDPDGREILRRTRDTVLSAHAHAEVPFERVVDEVQPERSLGRSPLFQVMLAHLQAGSSRVSAAGVEMSFAEIDTGTSKFDLSVWVRETADGPEGRLVYKADLFDRSTIARLEGHLRTLLLGLAAGPDRRLSELPLLSPAERQQLVVEWNATNLPEEPDGCLHEILARQAALTPDAPALLTDAGTISFRGLEARADRLARSLRTLGVGPESLVGVCADRSPEALIALLGIWKAGGAYLPLDPAYPIDRLLYVLADAQPAVVVARPGALPVSPGVVVVTPDGFETGRENESPAAWPADPDNLAYVLYTSGSTGRPKGIMIRHRSVANLSRALARTVYAGLPGGLRIGINASLAFDGSVKQLIQLLHGHSVCTLPEEVRLDGRKLLEFASGKHLDAVDCTPSQLALVLEEVGGQAMPLARVLVGGEAVDEALWSELARRGEGVFWNVYGPTECTVDATVCPIGEGRPRLGRPLANVRIFLADRELQPVPAGVPGEMLIGGAGLARGYQRRPGLTAARFIPDPFGDEAGGRLYRTGDLARRWPDGTLEFLGRVDQQVKIRGFRVELGEIESLVHELPGVEQAVVLFREDRPGDRRLVAYFTGSAVEGELRAALRRSLPEAMVPGVFVRLDRFPLTPSGKVDRRALPAPGRSMDQETILPRTPVEEGLAGIWAALLRTDRVGVADNFFEAGGHSLLAAQLVSRVRQAYGIEVPLRALFEAPTIEGLARTIETMRGEESAGRGAAPVLAIKARPRGQRDFSQLVGELGQISSDLSPEQVMERLRASGTLPGGSRDPR